MAHSQLAVPASPEQLCVQVERGEKAIRLLDGRWDGLVLRQPVPNPTLSATWLREAATWGQGEPLVIAVKAGDQLVAGGAFGLLRPAWHFGPRIATWLGRNGRPVQTPDVLVDPDIKDAGYLLVDALLKEVSAVLVGPSPIDGAFCFFLRDRTPWLHIRPEVDGWVVPLPPPKLERYRQKVAYRLRRATRLGAEIVIPVAKDPEAVAAALERLFVLHQERWQGRDDQSYFSRLEEHRAWHRRAVAAMATRGHVRVVEVFEDGNLVASVLGLLAGHAAFFHTSAARVNGRLKGPGHVALLAWVEEAMAAGAVVMDLGETAGEAGGPKAVLGPTMVRYGSFQAACSPAMQGALNGTLWFRAWVRLVQRQMVWRWK